MSKNKTWSPPGWPWELDILALVFVVVALVLPYSIRSQAIDAASASTVVANPAATVLSEQMTVLWAIGIVVLYVMHLAMAGASLEMISTPFIHLVSPLAFSLIAYYRVFAAARETNKVTVVTGSPVQIIVLALAIVAATLLVARIRMARSLLRFRDIKWDVQTKSLYDKTYFELMTQLVPLVYPPRAYRACEEGILVEGWFYIMPVPFEMVQTINAVNSVGIASTGKYYASSARSLIRMELLDSSDPLFISPAQRDEMLQYCAHHVARLRPTKGGTKSGRPATQTGTSDEQSRHTSGGVRKP